MIKQIIPHIKKSLDQKMGELFGPHKTITFALKDDQTPVTEVDLLVSKLIKDFLIHHPVWSLLSEEESERELCFPLVVIDPIDGTEELRQGVPECAVSLALLRSPSLLDHQEAWIYNPFSGFQKTEDHIPIKGNFPYHDHPLLGVVSRSEWKRGLFSDYAHKNPQILLAPRGSIAFKLALLSSQAVDFVISLRPKKLWDIAAGTILCQQQEIFFYEQGQRITQLDRLTYNPPLIWCRPAILTKLRDHFQN